MFEEDGIFVAFDDTEEDLTEALRRIGILPYIERIEDPQQGEAARQEAISALRSALNEIKDLPVNEPEGEFSIRFKNKHFSLWKTSITLLEAGVQTVATIKAPPAALALFLTIHKLTKLIKKLDQNELLVIDALETVIWRKQIHSFSEEGASREEIEKLFAERGVEPPDVEGILKNLALEEKNVLRSMLGADGKTWYYTLVP
ncbi:MAG: hypothetical protein MN733_37190 [Nitrososphaera sp.]|nr:hypothetical protein [Nitrososphaera sp.]